MYKIRIMISILVSMQCTMSQAEVTLRVVEKESGDTYKTLEVGVQECNDATDFLLGLTSQAPRTDDEKAIEDVCAGNIESSDQPDPVIEQACELYGLGRYETNCNQ